jgi:hypothetical protein
MFKGETTDLPENRRTFVRSLILPIVNILIVLRQKLIKISMMEDEQKLQEKILSAFHATKRSIFLRD